MHVRPEGDEQVVGFGIQVLETAAGEVPQVEQQLELNLGGKK